MDTHKQWNESLTELIHFLIKCHCEHIVSWNSNSLTLYLALCSRAGSVGKPAFSLNPYSCSELTVVMWQWSNSTNDLGHSNFQCQISRNNLEWVKAHDVNTQHLSVISQRTLAWLLALDRSCLLTAVDTFGNIKLIIYLVLRIEDFSVIGLIHSLNPQHHYSCYVSLSHCKKMMFLISVFVFFSQ